MHWTKQNQISDLARHLIFHRLSSFNCCLIKGITQKKLHAVFCPNKQRSFEPFICLDPVSVHVLLKPNDVTLSSSCAVRLHSSANNKQGELICARQTSNKHKKDPISAYSNSQMACKKLQFSSVHDGIYALGKAIIMRSTPSLSSFPNAVFETVPMFV